MSQHERASGFRKKLDWPPLSRVAEDSQIPEGFSLDQLEGNEVTELARLLRAWYPDIHVGSESCHLNPRFYREKVFLKGGARKRDIICGVVKKNTEIVAMETVQRDVDARTVCVRLAVIHPKHRGTGLSHFVLAFLEAVGRASGAELAYSFISLKTLAHQVGPPKMGFELVGIVPAFDRDLVEPNKVRRVFEAIWAKVLVERQQLLVPDKSQLSDRMRLVWETLFEDRYSQ